MASNSTKPYNESLTLSTASLEITVAELNSAGKKWCPVVPVKTLLKEGLAAICTVPCANIARVSGVTTRLGKLSDVQAFPTHNTNNETYQ